MRVFKGTAKRLFNWVKDQVVNGIKDFVTSDNFIESIVNAVMGFGEWIGLDETTLNTISKKFCEYNGSQTND